MEDPQFLQFLGLPGDADQETATLSVTAILTSAVRDPHPSTSLSDLYHKVTTQNGSQYLDPLHALPLLVDCPDAKAQELISVVGECCSPREALIATQECLERLSGELQRDDDEDDEDKRRAPIDVLLTIIDLYRTGKVKLRNRSGFETVKSHFVEVQDAISAATNHLRPSHAQRLFIAVSELVVSVNNWLKVDDKDIAARVTLLSGLLDRALEASSHALHTQIAKRTFEATFPRFRRPGGTEDWNEAEDALQQVFAAFEVLGKGPKEFADNPSPTSLIALAHLPYDTAVNLSSFLPIIIASIHSNSLLDETLAVLIKYLCHPGTVTVSDEVAGSLLSVLPELASGHSDPQIRHLTFRILSRLLSMTPPALRMEILADLTGHSEFPQMRIAAVGLVKEALLEALNTPSGNPFASPLFLRTFGRILFQTNPSDLLTSDSTTLESFVESEEPKRLVECLSLYYVLLERDVQNLTGTRSQDVLKSVETSLLLPLKTRMAQWSAEAGSDSHDDHFNPLLPIEISLERVEAAKAKLQ
ncbi:hypothetical protein D9611_006576 [Ephemerocybe angulata]|uniref:Uncharacterized protein n=1 Tax=Ephemerocybe angulata TaxID=980116 RepID=A0A8H5C797_9AGAR|nr:hypothetical protein D9611_006576 [Tulosesus angulatus]